MSFIIQIIFLYSTYFYYPIETSMCPDNMVYVSKKNFCMDKYEAPNIEGERPISGLNFYDAQNYCSSNKKRLCTEEEWEFVCTNEMTTIYPYGNFYSKGTCNDDKSGYVPVPWNKMATPEWKDIVRQLTNGKIDPSGSREKCHTYNQIYDLTGNVAEIVESKTRQYGFAVKGGFFYGVYGNALPTCYFSNFAHEKKFASYEFSVRCCKTP